jgi:hypothetical protein
MISLDEILDRTGAIKVNNIEGEIVAYINLNKDIVFETPPQPTDSNFLGYIIRSDEKVTGIILFHDLKGDYPSIGEKVTFKTYTGGFLWEIFHKVPIVANQEMSISSTNGYQSQTVRFYDGILDQKFIKT